MTFNMLTVPRSIVVSQTSDGNVDRQNAEKIR
jgi:hypothetical protein